MSRLKPFRATPVPPPFEAVQLLARIAELELQLNESEETLSAIRRGEIDALVMGGQLDDQRVYTLESSDRPYQVLIEQMQEGAVTLAENGVILYCNRRVASMLEVPQERVIGRGLEEFILPADNAAFVQLLEDATRFGARSELTLQTASGALLPVYMSINQLQLDRGASLLCGVLTDLTEQKLHLRELGQANTRLLEEIAERERAEGALRQAQKMEAVGQLTGGLAHDFNNLLTGITGSLELLQLRIVQGRLGELGRYIEIAQGAAKRAAALTHRLLAFSRQQTLDPVPTNANRLITGMKESIQRTIGPEIALETPLLESLWPTLCDPNQLENAILNLSINARDAMPDGGRLVIETSNESFDEGAARLRDLPRGQYVVVSVTDTGVGMMAETVTRAFDPFFTTKPIGMGTGLGLSMIHGFARQSGGQVRIESNLGKGTAVRMYLPRHAAEESIAGDSDRTADESAPKRSGEVVLVVDDDPGVRMFVCEVLGELGFTTIEAADGQLGLQILQSDIGIDLLITDVGLPGLNGRQVADAGRAHRPKLKILFITGYADKVAVGDDQLADGMEIMTKPFTMLSLTSKVTTMLAFH